MAGAFSFGARGQRCSLPFLISGEPPHAEHPQK
jgi:hypothetical protein